MRAERQSNLAGFPRVAEVEELPPRGSWRCARNDVIEQREDDAVAGMNSNETAREQSAEQASTIIFMKSIYSDQKSEEH